MNVVHLKSGMETVTWLTEAQYENPMPCAPLYSQQLFRRPYGQAGFLQLTYQDLFLLFY